MLDLAQDAVIEARRRQFVPKAREVGREMAFDGGREALLRSRLLVGGDHGGLREFRIDHGGGDRFLRIERGEPTREVLELTHVTRPAVPLEPFKRGLLELLARQAFPLYLREKVP